jgi:hypothetical protein
MWMDQNLAGGQRKPLGYSLIVDMKCSLDFPIMGRSSVFWRRTLRWIFPAFPGFSRPGRVQAGKDGLALELGNVE